MKRYALYIFCTLFASCAGYHWVDNDNPLYSSGIKSIAVPMFINLSIIPNVSGGFTREVVNILNQYPGLKVYPGEYKKADAILIGIITSPEHRQEVYKVGSTMYAVDGLKEAISPRRQYFFPTTNTFKISVQIAVIKDPSYQEIESLKNMAKLDVPAELQKTPKMIFNSTFSYTGNFTRELKASDSVDGGGPVNGTKSKDSMERVIQSLASDAGRGLQELVLNAY